MIMPIPEADRLYQLLPSLYRERDADEGYPLRGLMRLVGEQAALVEGDVRRLYDDLFIETCRHWVIPYIGDLVGNDLLFDADRIPQPDSARDLFRNLAGPDLRPPPVVRTRADVAKTIYYRRRKGTPAMLEELARDVTGWPARVVEFFELLGWTQFREHIRLRAGWADLRSVECTDRIDGPFDVASHTVDVRPIGRREGWYNIHNIGFFLWRLGSYPLTNVPARQAAGQPWRYHFSPLGNPAPLFSRWRREGDEAGLATELHVAGPIRPAFFADDLARYRARFDAAAPRRPNFTDLYGQPVEIPGSPLETCRECSFFVVRNSAAGRMPVAPAQDPNVPPDLFQPQIVCRRLDPWPANQPAGRVIEVDVDRGRLVVGAGWPDATTGLDVYFHHGFSADLGGGPYERRPWLVADTVAAERFEVREGEPNNTAAGVFGSLTAALTRWASAAVNRRNAVITIVDSRTYALPGTIALRNEGWLVIQAANGQRPLLQTAAAGLRVDVQPPAPGVTSRDAALTLSGVVVEGSIEVAGDIRALRLLHSTVVPGRRLAEADGAPVVTNQPSVALAAMAGGNPINAQARVEAAFSITGPIVAPVRAEGIWLLDSVVDGLGGTAIGGNLAAAPGPALTVERSTILGEARVRALEASEAIFTGRVATERTQEGCVRFSYITPGSVTSRRHRCQPDLEVEAAIAAAVARNPLLTQAERDALRDHVGRWLRPSFTTTRYGLPAYAQLHAGCPAAIRTGAEDGAEMGAFSHLKQPQREGNLRVRLQEYLPFGLEPGILYVT